MPGGHSRQGGVHGQLEPAVRQVGLTHAAGQLDAAHPVHQVARLLEVPDLGLLHVENFARVRTTIAVQYWRSLDDLHRFARSADHPHLRAWHEFNRRLAGSGDVGVWHETYLTGPGSVEAVYSDMPTFGLAAATTHVPVRQVGNRAAERLAATPS